MYNLSLNKNCPDREVKEYLVREGDNSATVLELHFGDMGDGPVDVYDKVKTRRIPEDTLPGNYYYEFKVAATCLPFNHHDHFIYRNGRITVL